jgi:hypothetical protein
VTGRESRSGADRPAARPPRKIVEKLVQALIHLDAVRPAGDLDEGSIKVQQHAGPREQFMRR